MISARLEVGGGQQVPHQRVPSSSGVLSSDPASEPAPSGPGDRDLVDPVGLLEPDADPLVGPGRQVLADVVGADRQLAVAAVDQHGQPDGAGPAEVAEGVQRGPHGTAGEQHVVDQHHHGVVDADRQPAAADRPGGVAAQVVAVHA